jgi:UDP-N-acetylmuramate dehydrogenase
MVSSDSSLDRYANSLPAGGDHANTLACPLIWLPQQQGAIQSRVSLRDRTSFRVGGEAEWYTSPRDREQLLAALAWGRSQDIPITLLGAGSNLLIGDGGLPGLVVCTRHLNGAHFDAETGQVTVAAGESLVRLAWQAAKLGWRGLEWMVGIPGTVGGATVMNAGAHNSCMADILVWAEVLEPDGTCQGYAPTDLDYQYRRSILQGSDRVVTQAILQLQPGFDPEQVVADTAAQLRQRRRSQPYHRPSCGSVFRNCYPYAAGWLIEQTGLKGYQIGQAQVAQRHANFILNCGKASASDILRLIRHVQEQVAHRWSIKLQPEVKILGDFPDLSEPTQVLV